MANELAYLIGWILGCGVGFCLGAILILRSKSQGE